MVSILHISDLHRSPNEPVDNDTLVAALLADRDRYLGDTPVIPPPDAIIVSGDLIKGSPIAHSTREEDILSQYRTAGKFLDHLTGRLLNGDRSKLVIVPGNHDVCWNTSLDSMERVPDNEYPDDVRIALMEPDSNYRWSWKERALYRIRDADTYARRMNPYWDFVREFYAGVPLLKGIDRHRGYQLFELHDRHIIVAAFDSITGNDCFRFSGEIPRGAVARCALELRDISHSYDVRIAVWHHSTQGPPSHDDYMDISQLYEMIGFGFQIGIHGHQHFAAATTYYVHLSERQSMAVIGAGSLCAGARELPRGINRQYNLIVIDEDFRHARVHVREIVEGEQFTRKSNGAFLEGYAELALMAHTDSAGRVIDTKQSNTRVAVLQAESALRSGQASKAIEFLKTVELLPGSHARRIAIDAAVKSEDWNFLLETIAQPQTTEEAVFLISGLIEIGNFAKAEAVLNSYQGIDAATRSDIEGRIEIKRTLRTK
jgi:hypothetical protein